MSLRDPALCSLVVLLTAPAAHAAPDPTTAATLSAAATAVPIGATALLWGTGRGTAEGLRFDLGLTFLAAGLVLGPAAGQLYAGATGDAVATTLIRTLTGGVAVAGIGLRARGVRDSTRQTGSTLAWLGGIPTGLLVIYDVFAAASNARRAAYREGHSAGPPPPITVAGLSLCRAVVGCEDRGHEAP